MDHQHCINYFKVFFVGDNNKNNEIKWRLEASDTLINTNVVTHGVLCFLAHNTLRGCPSYRRVQIFFLFVLKRASRSDKKLDT